MGKALLKVNDSHLSTLLASVVFALALSGGSNLISFYVWFYEMLFIFAFFLHQGHFRFTFPILTSQTNKRLFFLWLLLITLSLTQLFLGDDLRIKKTFSVISFLMLITHLLFAFAVADYLKSSGRDISWILLLIPCSVGLVSLIYLYTVIGLTALPTGFTDNPPLGMNIRHVGFLAATGSIISCYKLLAARNALSVIVFFGIALANLSLLFWLEGRAAIGAVVICCILIIFYLAKQQAISALNVVAITITFALSYSIASGLSLPQTTQISTSPIIYSEVSSSVNTFTAGRWHIWQTALSEIQEKPLLGSGPDGYRFIDKNERIVHPHNLFIQILVDWGIAGSIVFMVLLSKVLKKTANILLNTDTTPGSASPPAILIVYVLLLHSLFDGTLYHAQPLFYLSLAAGVLLSGQIKNVSPS